VLVVVRAGKHRSATARHEHHGSQARYGVHFPPPGRLAAMALQSAALKHIPTVSAKG
jgi:hypothetical protein